MTSAAITLRFSAQGQSGGTPPAHGAGRGRAAPPIDPRLLDTPVLIIEDEAMIAWTLESLFDDMGFTHIALAPNAAAAIAAAAREAPGLIVSDINLGSGPDGVEAVATITAAARVPAIFVTGYPSEDARARIAQAVPGAAVLRKPVQADDLVAAVAAALAEPTAH